MFDMLPQVNIRKVLLNNDINGLVNHLIHEMEASTPRDEVS